MRKYLIGVRIFFLRMVAETPALDALRILYVSASFSRSISMNSAFIRTIQCFGISADARRKTAQDYFHFSAPTQVTIFWSFCGRRRKTPRVYYHFAHLRTIQCFGVSADIREFYCC